MLHIGDEAYISKHIYIYIYIHIYIYSVADTENALFISIVNCSYFEYCRRRKWTQQPEFKSLRRLFVFYVALIPTGKVCLQLFSLQL